MKFKVRRSQTKGFVIIGILFLIGGLCWITANYLYSQNKVSIKGRVADFDIYESTNDYDGVTKSYSPIFQYEFKGKTYSHETMISRSSPGYQLNESVDLLIDPKKPDNVIINNFRERWYGPVWIIFCGLCSFALAYAINLYGT